MPDSSSSPQTGAPATGTERRRRRRTKRSLLWRFRRFFFMLALLLVAGVAGAGYVLSQISLPEQDERLAETSFICTSEVALGECGFDNAAAQLTSEENRIVVGYNEIAQVMKDATIAAEDQNFWEHGGVDPAGIARAVWADVRNSSESVQGGSTITQQYVKNVFLTNERTITRKVREAVYAVQLERELEKEEILERYLNTIYFGRGAYGVEAASRVYFGKNANELNLGDAAYLAGLIRAPEAADAERNPREAKRRRHTVLVNMLEEGYIDRQQFEFADNVQWVFSGLAPLGGANIKPRQELDLFSRVKNHEYGTEYFYEFVRQQLVEDFGEETVYEGGLRVYTTLHQSWQQEAYETVTGTLDREGDPEASIVAIGQGGRVRAMMAGRDFDVTEVNLAVGDKGGGSGRQPGSTFKTFAFVEALRRGYSANATLPAPSAISIPIPGQEPWEVSGGGSSAGERTLRTATQFSSNTVYAQLMTKLGPQSVIDTARDLGVETEMEAHHSAVLGTGEISVLDMAAAYNTLREGGLQYDPVVIERVEDADGNILFQADPTPERIVSQELADQVTTVLQSVVEGGTGASAAVDGREVAGKTGTTQNNKDAWFAGYTCNVASAVWMGYVGTENSPVRPMDNVHGIKVQGGNFPAQMWSEFNTRIRDLLPAEGCDLADVSEFPGELLDFDDDDESGSTGSDVELVDVRRVRPGRRVPPAPTGGTNSSPTPTPGSDHPAGHPAAHDRSADHRSTHHGSADHRSTHHGPTRQSSELIQVSDT